MAIINSTYPTLWKSQAIEIAAGNTLVVDTYPLANFKTTKLYIEINQPSTGKTLYLEMLAMQDTTGTVSDSIYSKLGDTIDVDVNFSATLTDAELAVTNNTATTVLARVTRLTN